MRRWRRCSRLRSFGARIALAHRLGLIEPEVKQALHALRKVRNDFAHSTADIALSEPAQQSRLADCYRQARTNPLWEPLEHLVQQQLRTQDPALVDFLEATARQIQPVPPALVMGLSGVRSGADGRRAAER